LASEKALTRNTAPSWIASPLMFNEEAPHPTSNLAVRQAIMTAVDPVGWNKAANGGRGVTTTSTVVKDGLCYDWATESMVPKPAGDVAKAKSMLLAAGYTAGADGKLSKDGKPLEITVLGQTAQNSGPEYVAEQIRQTGAAVTLKQEALNFTTLWVA